MSDIESDMKFMSDELGAPSGVGDRFARQDAGVSATKSRVDLFRENIGGGFGATARGDFFAGVRDNDSGVSFFTDGEVGITAYGKNYGAGYHNGKVGFAGGSEDFGAAVVINQDALFEGAQLMAPSVQLRVKSAAFQFSEQGCTIKGDLKSFWKELQDSQPFLPSDFARQDTFFSTFEELTSALEVSTSLKNNKARVLAGCSNEAYSFKTGYEVNIDKGSSSQRITLYGVAPQGSFIAELPLNSEGPTLKLSPSATPHIRFTLSEDYQEAMYKREITF